MTNNEGRMNLDELKTKLIELENHPILSLSDEEIGEDFELIAIKASVMTRILGFRHILSRKE